LKVAAVVSWYGVTDLVEMMDSPAARTWLGSNPDREQLAKRISPLTYVRAGLPPMFLLHSVTDPIAPYSQSVRLHEALDKVGVANELLTIPGGSHGYLCCNLTERLDAYRKIREFLTRHRVIGSSN
jgi:dipeptidyl aminopeptidase/acylaminoacyl peptidase